MKQFLAIILLMLGVSVVSGQTGDSGVAPKAACNLTMAQAPDVVGLRLGMTVEQVLALFPGSREDNELRLSLSKPPTQFGMTTFMIAPDKYTPKAKPSGIGQITVTLLDGRVSGLNVNYNGTEWKHVDQFVAKFSEGKNLPAPDAWEAYVGMDTQLKTLNCKDFELSVFAGGKNVQNMNYVQMRDASALKKLKERKAKAREMDKLKQAIPGASLISP